MFDDEEDTDVEIHIPPLLSERALAEVQGFDLSRAPTRLSRPRTFTRPYAATATTTLVLTEPAVLR